MHTDLVKHGLASAGPCRFCAVQQVRALGRAVGQAPPAREKGDDKPSQVECSFRCATKTRKPLKIAVSAIKSAMQNAPCFMHGLCSPFSAVLPRRLHKTRSSPRPRGECCYGGARKVHYVK
nr:MAG TPA: hypothetical protein [Caudoviricetes sp.]